MADFADLARKAQLLRQQLLEAQQQKKKAEGEHERLIGVLRELSRRLNCTGTFDLGQATGRLFHPEPNPDVEGEGVGAVFVGDAKDAANETAGKEDSRRRVLRYLYALSTLVNSGKVPVAYFVIATNDENAAKEWADALKLAAGFCNLYHIVTGRTDFEVWQHDAKTWIVW